jgi:V8-like Glu-specific endopeptidase
MAMRTQATVLLVSAILLTSCRTGGPPNRDKKALRRIEVELASRASNQMLFTEQFQVQPAAQPGGLGLSSFTNDELLKALLDGQVRIHDPDTRVTVPIKLGSVHGQLPKVGKVVVNPAIARNLDAVAAVVDSVRIGAGNPCTLALPCVLNTETYDHTPLGKALCDGVPFKGDPMAALCTAFLVGPDTIATAAHCVDDGNLKDKRFIFGFRGSNHMFNTIFTPDQVYSGCTIISRNPDTPDYAVVKLDRTVSGRLPVEIDRGHKITLSERLYVIGHPAGLPLMLANGGTVKMTGDDLFVAELNILTGNSGSPVFLESSNKVVGILTDGTDGYVDIGKCSVLSVCKKTVTPIPDCEGEGCTPIGRVPDFQAGPCP